MTWNPMRQAYDLPEFRVSVHTQCGAAIRTEQRADESAEDMERRHDQAVAEHACRPLGDQENWAD